MATPILSLDHYQQLVNSGTKLFVAFTDRESQKLETNYLFFQALAKSRSPEIHAISYCTVDLKRLPEIKEEAMIRNLMPVYQAYNWGFSIGETGGPTGVEGLFMVFSALRRAFRF